MTSLRALTYENVRWEPQGVRYASAALPKYGTYHPALLASIADLEQAAAGEVIERAMRIAGDHGKLDADQAEEFGRRVREIATEFRS